MANKAYDCVILGGGAAGLTAAIYGQRYGMTCALISRELGGATAWAGEIENYPGFVGSGRELMDKFEHQARMFGTEIILEGVSSVAKSPKGFVVTTETGQKIVGKTVISGLGSAHRKLGIKGEHELLGKGVSVCATCDGNFFKGKTVIVVGGGDAAGKAILYLSDICKKVYASYRKEPLRCEPIYLKRILERKNVEMLYNTELTEILGEKKVTGVTMKSSVAGKKATYPELALDGVFCEIGADPVIEPFKELKLELEGGAIKINAKGETNVSGFFAAGDGSSEPFKQTVTAAAGGAVAAKTAFDFLQRK